MKIVADSHIPYIRGLFEPFAEVSYIPGRDISPADVADTDALLVRTRTRCDETLLEGSRVRFIGTATIGTDHIDTAYCRDKGIEVVSAPGSNARGVLQWVGAALALLSQKDGWQPEEMTLGIVGVGHVGSLIKEFGAAWGFRVLCSDPPREIAEGLTADEGFAGLTEIAAQADIVTFHTPLTKDGEHPTWRMAGNRFFDAIKPGAAVINSARGNVVDETALKKAIDKKGVTACIDTWAGEPDIDQALLERALAGTPHIGGYTVQGKANASAAVVNALARRFCLPLSDWYPLEEKPRPYASPITWGEMVSTIKRYCDTEAETATLKKDRSAFETMRDNYLYREEYF